MDGSNASIVPCGVSRIRIPVPIKIFYSLKLADQLKMYKLDVEKKDRLINELSNYREVERVQVCNHSHDSYIDKSMFEQNKREMASLSAKYESIQNEVSAYFN